MLVVIMISVVLVDDHVNSNYWLYSTSNDDYGDDAVDDIHGNNDENDNDGDVHDNGDNANDGDDDDGNDDDDDDDSDGDVHDKGDNANDGDDDASDVAFTTRSDGHANRMLIVMH